MQASPLCTPFYARALSSFESTWNMGADQPREIGERECQFSGSEAYTSAKITAETALLPPLSDVRRLPISIGNFDRLGLLANTAYKEKVPSLSNSRLECGRYWLPPTSSRISIGRNHSGRLQGTGRAATLWDTVGMATSLPHSNGQTTREEATVIRREHPTSATLWQMSARTDTEPGSWCLRHRCWAGRLPASHIVSHKLEIYVRPRELRKAKPRQIDIIASLPSRRSPPPPATSVRVNRSFKPTIAHWRLTL